MNAIKIFLITALIASTSAYTQQKVVEFPVEIDTIFQGIKTKIIIKQITTEPQRAYADMVIGFYNPALKEWVFFHAPEAPISRKGFIGSFLLKLIKKTEGEFPDLQFLELIIKPGNEGTFQWRCDCIDILKNIVL